MANDEIDDKKAPSSFARYQRVKEILNNAAGERCPSYPSGFMPRSSAGGGIRSGTAIFTTCRSQIPLDLRPRFSCRRAGPLTALRSSDRV
jgi:hypothetical protein